jgi:hypothetical protein
VLHHGNTVTVGMRVAPRTAHVTADCLRVAESGGWGKRGLGEAGVAGSEGELVVEPDIATRCVDFRAPLLRGYSLVYPYVIHQHGLRKNCAGVRISRPVAADREVE